MGKATGVFLILAGVGTAALILPAVDQSAERQLGEVVRIATGAVPHASEAPPSGTPAAAPSAVRTVPTETKTAAPVLITPPQVVVRNTTTAPARVNDVQSRQALARDIQKELKRVGCYDGEVSGEWTPRTRQAMKVFIDHVNAALPVDEPDHILKTMVQGHPGRACGQACPSGQTANQAGHCAPVAIIAQNTPSSGRNGRNAPAAGEPHTTAAAPRDVAQLKPTVPKPAWETEVAAAQPPAVEPYKPEGRMAAGAPMTPPGATSAANSGVGIVPNARPKTIAPPGAIAALTDHTSRTGPRTVRTNDAPQPLVASAEPVAGSSPATRPEQAELTTAAPPRPHRTRQVYHAPPPEKFKFPPPNFVGGPRTAQAYGSYRKPESSSFRHLFDRLARESR